MSHALKVYVQVAGDPSDYVLCRPIFALEDTTYLFFIDHVLGASQCHDRVFLMLLEMGQNSGVPTNLGGVLYYLYPPSGADEVSRQSWQLITAIHDEWFMMV
jgi:hypothetical protein